MNSRRNSPTRATGGGGENKCVRVRPVGSCRDERFHFEYVVIDLECDIAVSLDKTSQFSHCGSTFLQGLQISRFTYCGLGHDLIKRLTDVLLNFEKNIANIVRDDSRLPRASSRRTPYGRFTKTRKSHASKTPFFLGLVHHSSFTSFLTRPYPLAQCAEVVAILQDFPGCVFYVSLCHVSA